MQNFQLRSISSEETKWWNCSTYHLIEEYSSLYTLTYIFSAEKKGATIVCSSRNKARSKQNQTYFWWTGTCHHSDNGYSSDKQKAGNHCGEFNMFPYLVPSQWCSLGSQRETGFLAACPSGELWKDEQNGAHIKILIALPQWTVGVWFIH